MSLFNQHGWSKPKAPEYVDINPEKGKRAKHVFGSGDTSLEHVWAHPLLKDGTGYYQTHARNPQGNFYFHTDRDGTRVIFSYRDSYPIGAMFEQGRKTVYLIRSGKPYSSTTAQHMSAVRQAVPHDALSFDVPFAIRFDHSRVTSQWFPDQGKPTKETHSANLADILERLGEHIENQNRARSTHALTWNHKESLRLWDMARRYAKLFGLRSPKLVKVPAIDKSRYNAAKSREDARALASRLKWEAYDRERKLETERKTQEWNASGFCKHEPRHEYERKHTCETQTETETFQASGYCTHEPRHDCKILCDMETETLTFQASGYCTHEPRHRAQYSCDAFERRETDRKNETKTTEEKIALWREGKHVTLPHLDYALLRMIVEIEGTAYVQTSQGVTVPVSGRAGAARLFRFLSALVDAKREYRRNGHTEHIGSFSVDSFKPKTLDLYPEEQTGEYVLTAGCHRITWTEIKAISDAVLLVETKEPEPETV